MKVWCKGRNERRHFRRQRIEKVSLPCREEQMIVREMGIIVIARNGEKCRDTFRKGHATNSENLKVLNRKKTLEI